MAEEEGRRFNAMTQAEANEECRYRAQQVSDKCGRCMMPVILHCASCTIQVTGCLCTEVDRFGQDEAWKRAVERFGEELARERYRAAGLFVPEVKKLLLPGEEG